MRLVIKNRVMDISNVEEFVHKMYGEGWIHEWSVHDSRGEIRDFVDKEGVAYRILYKKNEHSVYVPKEILQIRIK